jgi:hypothetical protein
MTNPDGSAGETPPSGPGEPPGHQPGYASGQPDPFAPLDYPYGPPYPPPPLPGAYPGPYPPPAAPYAPPAGYPYAPFDPYGRPPGTNGLAVGSLVCSLAGVLCCLPAPAGLILGIIGMRETRRTGQEGYGFAVAGTVIGALVTVGIVLYVVLILIGASVAPN